MKWTTRVGHSKRSCCEKNMCAIIFPLFDLMTKYIRWGHAKQPVSLMNVYTNSLKWCNRNKLHRVRERDSTLAHFFALFGGLGLRLGYLATSGANLTSYSCSPTPISCKRDHILRVSRVVYEIWRGTDRQTADRRQTRRPKQKALTL